MGISLRFFDSPSDLVKYVDQQLAETRDLVLSHTGKLEEARRKFDTKKQNASKQSARQVSDIGGFRMLANPSPDYELSLLDEAIKTAHEKIEALEKGKKLVIPALRNSAKITAIFDNEVLTAFMYHDEPR